MVIFVKTCKYNINVNDFMQIKIGTLKVQKMCFSV